MAISDGKVIFEDDRTIIQVKEEPYALDYGAECINPDAPENERIYQKVYTERPIFYGPKQFTPFVEKYFAGDNDFVLGMNGYSSLKPDFLERYQIQKGAYEAACTAVLSNVIRHLRAKFDNKARIKLAYGVSDMGVDKAIKDAAVDTATELFGVSCPRYLLYADDSPEAVYLGRNKDEYADYFVRLLDFLVGAGGRGQALQHDVFCGCLHGVNIHFIDIPSMLSKTGNVPATIIDADGNPTIENAAAAFGNLVSFFGKQEAVIAQPAGGDIWDALFDNVQSKAVSICRSKMSPSGKF